MHGRSNKRPLWMIVAISCTFLSGKARALRPSWTTPPRLHRWSPYTKGRRAFVASTKIQEHEHDLTKGLPIPRRLNLYTASLDEVRSLVCQEWGFPEYRAKQVHHWIRERGVMDVNAWHNVPETLKTRLKAHLHFHTPILTNNSNNDNKNDLEAEAEELSTGATLRLIYQQTSQKDGTIKRAYELLRPDTPPSKSTHSLRGQLIESVLMPYKDGRYTACVSSQAGCAMGCTFCATGQMGFAGQLTAEEIFEQVARFDAHLRYQQQQSKPQSKSQSQSEVAATRGLGVTNVVMMGMGEPLANYPNVKRAIQHMHTQLHLSYRKITISTVGVIPAMYQLLHDTLSKTELPNVRLAVSLHCATHEERSKLLPSNDRYGGLDKLMACIQEYVQKTKKRVSFEWALIEGENDTPEKARELGDLLVAYGLTKKKPTRRLDKYDNVSSSSPPVNDKCHVNLIPLNPTNQYGGTPTGRARVAGFVKVLQEEYGVGATPRVRRGIDIDAGCGQLKATIHARQQRKQQQQQQQQQQREAEVMRTEEESGLKMEEEAERMSRDLETFFKPPQSLGPITSRVGVFEHDETDMDNNNDNNIPFEDQLVDLDAAEDEFDEHEKGFQNVVFQSPEEMAEVKRLLNLVEDSSGPSVSSKPAEAAVSATVAATSTATSKATTTTNNNNNNNANNNNDDNTVHQEELKKTKRRKKKVQTQLRRIEKLKTMHQQGMIRQYNQEQRIKLGKEEAFRQELMALEEQLRLR